MASPVTIQPATKDTRLDKSFPTTNYGTTADLYVGNFIYKDFIIAFDCDASVPAGATIVLATMSLYARLVGAGRTINCYRLRRTDWVETEATWNNYKTDTAWGTAGALNATTDHDTTDGASSDSLSSAGWQDWTVTAQVQYARDNVSGITHFFVVDLVPGSSAQQIYRSSDDAAAEQRPKLYIEYTVPSTFIPKCVFF